MSSKMKKPVIEVIDLVDSDDEQPIPVIDVDSSAPGHKISYIIPGVMVSTPYGYGQVIYSKEVEEEAKNQTGRKRPRAKESATIDYSIFYRVQLSYGIATLNKSIVKPLESSSYSDRLRCHPRMMFNDNIINFAIDRMKQPDNAIVFNTFLYDTIKKYVNGSGFDSAGKRNKLRRIIKKNLDNVKYMIFPINADLHWSVVILCNFNILHDRMNMIRDMRREALSGIMGGLSDCSPTVRKAKIRKCLEDYEFSQKVEKSSKSDDIPCFMHIDSAKLHRTQPIYVILRKLCSFLMTSNPDTGTSISVEADERLGSDIGSSQQDAHSINVDNAVIDSISMPGFSAIVPQQSNNFDCGPLMLQFCEQFLASAPAINSDFIRCKGETYFNQLDWKAIPKLSDAYRVKLATSLNAELMI